MTGTRARRRAKIVATLGPATDGIEADLVAAGLDVARLNFSHGEHEEHARRCAAVRRAAAEQGRSVAIMQDLQGPKIRVGRLVGGGPLPLRVGDELRITNEDILGTRERIGCTYEGLPGDVRPNDALLLDDGRIRLRALAVEGNDVLTVVEDGGLLGEHKGINLPGVAVSAPALTEKDRRDLHFGLGDLEVDYVALSFIRAAHEVQTARELVREWRGTAQLVVKLEKGEALADLEAILDAADGVMVARGDLGVELAPETVPMIQKRVIRLANERGLPVITATQMLESMIQEETPTRAEATDVANAVWDGTDAVMLSAETAAGQHPILAITMMDRIVRAAESAEVAERPARRKLQAGEDTTAAAVTHAAQVLAEDLGAAAIVGVTGTGRTARALSRGRPRASVYIFSDNAQVCRRLALWWGVTPIHTSIEGGLELRISTMSDMLLERGHVQPGDRMVVTGVHPYVPGEQANFVKYQVVSPPSPVPVLAPSPDPRPTGPFLV